jgi:hypothetical protein
MSFADVFVLGGGVLVLLLIFALVRQSRRHSYRLRDLTDLSSGIDPDWERALRTMHPPEKPPEERSS